MQHQQLSSVVFQLTTHVNQFKRLVDTLGSSKDTRALRERLSASRDAVQALAREASAGLKALHQQVTDEEAEGAPPAAAYHAKLVKEFHSVLKEFQAAQRTCLDREAMYAPQAETPSQPMRQLPNLASPHGSRSADGIEMGGVPTGLYEQAQEEGQPLLRSQTMELQGEVDYNDAMIQDRQQGIEDIHEQILEVNEIFQDLAVLVNDQGAMLDDIEANMVRTSAKTKDATRELRQADKSQRSSRNKMCCLMMFFLVVLVILIVVLIKT